MLSYTIVLFGITAVGGLILAAKVLTGKLPSWPVSVIHALLGASGLVLLTMMVINGNGAGQITAALGLLIIAALGGFFLASLHLRKKVAPKFVVIVHAGVAVAGFLTLLSALLAA